jgi:hypothetical protein
LSSQGNALGSISVFDEETATKASMGVYIPSYWMNFEKSASDADVRAAEVSTRFYSPTGNCASLNIDTFVGDSPWAESAIPMCTQNLVGCKIEHKKRPPRPSTGAVSAPAIT